MKRIGLALLALVFNASYWVPMAVAGPHESNHRPAAGSQKKDKREPRKEEKKEKKDLHEHKHEHKKVGKPSKQNADGF